MDYGVFHRAARRSVLECVLEKVETVEVRRSDSLSRGLVERRKFHGARTNALALARRFAAAGFSFAPAFFFSGFHAGLLSWSHKNGDADDNRHNSKPNYVLHRLTHVVNRRGELSRKDISR